MLSKLFVLFTKGALVVTSIDLLALFYRPMIGVKLICVEFHCWSLVLSSCHLWQRPGQQDWPLQIGSAGYVTKMG
jgi:hypothetical protein